jgi:hypothetical protein
VKISVRNQEIGVQPQERQDLLKNAKADLIRSRCLTHLVAKRTLKIHKNLKAKLCRQK